MPTWAIMIGIQAIGILGTLALILWFMYRKNDALDEMLGNKKGDNQ